MKSKGTKNTKFVFARGWEQWVNLITIKAKEIIRGVIKHLYSLIVMMTIWIFQNLELYILFLMKFSVSKQKYSPQIIPKTALQKKVFFEPHNETIILD